MEDMREMYQFRATAPGREKLLNWITESWDFLSHDTIVSGFEKANMISARIPANYVEQSAESLTFHFFKDFVWFIIKVIC